MALSKTALKRVINSVPEPDGDDVGKWVVGVCRTIEAEVRKLDDALILQLVEALILQLVEALEDLAEAGAEAWSEERPCVRIGKEVAAAGRARLEGKPCA